MAKRPGKNSRKAAAGHRSLFLRVKTAKGRKVSSTRWLERHFNDPYVQRVKIDGLRSRAAYKLIEIDQKYNLLRQGMRIVDLGAAPGGWSQVAAQKAGSKPFEERVIGVDYLPVEPIAGVKMLEKDFLQPDAPALLEAALNGYKADIVLSDMAPPTTGHKQTDHMRIIHLCEAAADFAERALAPGGAFVAKVFQGGAEQNLLQALKRRYKSVAHYKPPASRKNSRETYLIARGYRPAESD